LRSRQGEPDISYITEENETIRVAAFSDGVFAIAMTLLVFQIKVPGHEMVARSGLGDALVALWPSYLAFATSFLSILVIWVHHHWIFALIRRVDRPFLYWNGLLLFFVTFVTFPTALLSEYLLHPEARLAANLYTGTFLAISLAFDALWRHASRNLLALDATERNRDEAIQVTKQYRFGPTLYFLTFCVSFVSVVWSISLCLSLAAFFALRGWPARA
jgi:uncharacterized membrane protein